MDRLLAPQGWRSRIQRLACGMLSVAMVGTIFSFTGCANSSSMRAAFAPYEYSSCCCINDLKLRLRAKSIWRQKYAHCYGNRANANDIKQGFIDGFVDTAKGGSGCPPMIAPASYGGLACLTHQKMAPASWFEGYPLGAAAAESCGYANRGQSRLNPQLLACMADKGCSPGCRPCQASACECGQAHCSGACGSVQIYGGGSQSIQEGMLDNDGSVIIEHSTPPIPVPANDLPVPAPTANQGLQAVPAPTDSANRNQLHGVEIASFHKPQAQAVLEDMKVDTIEMPNMQVRFEIDSDEWVFGDVDVARALLQLDSTTQNATTTSDSH